jgi:GntR family transcriptional regulator, rspAB operon transcriptional repressor
MMPSNPFENLLVRPPMFVSRRRRSHADEIYDELRRLIVSLELAPNVVLSEKELCDRFGVSRTPVREALLRLAEHGLVTIAPQHGTFVSGIDPRAVRQSHFLRVNLEIPVAHRLCAAIGLDLSRPRNIVAQQSGLAENNDYSAFLPLDDAFHESLFELADLGEVWAIIHRRKAHLDRIRFLQAPQPGKLSTLVQEHAAILDAIGSADRQKAEDVIRRHVSGAIGFMEELLRSQAELFDASSAKVPRQASEKRATMRRRTV